MSNYLKYLKYKKKYLLLQSQKAGGIKSAEKVFMDIYNIPIPELSNVPEIQRVIELNENDYKQLINENNGMNYLSIYNEDQRRKIKDGRKYHKTRLLKNSIADDFKENILQENKDGIFKSIINKINEYLDDDTTNYIDFIVKLYINNMFGRPNSFRHIELFKTLIDDYKKVIDNKAYLMQQGISVESLIDINSFTSLELFDKYVKSSNVQEMKKMIDERDRLIRIKKEKEGAKAKFKTKPIYKSDNITIYQPKNENESKYHGSNTKWCTAADKDNMFNQYNQTGPLYIIEKNNGATIDKYQLHIQTNSMMDSEDNPIEIEMFIDNILLRKNIEDIKYILFLFINNIINIQIKNNTLLIEGTNELYTKFVTHLRTNNILDNKLIIDNIIKRISDATKEINPININTINISIDSFEYFKDQLKPFFSDNLIYFTFNCNTPVRDLLYKCTNLRMLRMPKYKYLLGDSLQLCNELVHLELDAYNEPLNLSLMKCTKLKELYLLSYNHPLENSLSNCTKLTKLYLPSYTHSLINPVRNCIILEQIDIGIKYLNQRMDDSELFDLIDACTNLKLINVIDNEQFKPRPRMIGQRFNIGELKEFIKFIDDTLTDINKARLTKINFRINFAL